MRLLICFVTCLFIAGCGSSPLEPTSATLTVHVTAEAFVSVITSPPQGQIAVHGVARFPNLPTGISMRVIASNNADTVDIPVTLRGDTDIRLILQPPH